MLRAASSDDPALERLAHEVIVPHVAQVDRRDETADLGNDLQEALVGEALECLAHRRAAHSVVFGDPGFGERLARTQGNRHDLLAQVLVDLPDRNPTAQAPVRRKIGWHSCTLVYKY